MRYEKETKEQNIKLEIDISNKYYDSKIEDVLNVPGTAAIVTFVVSGIIAIISFTCYELTKNNIAKRIAETGHYVVEISMLAILVLIVTCILVNIIYCRGKIFYADVVKELKELEKYDVIKYDVLDEEIFYFTEEGKMKKIIMIPDHNKEYWNKDYIKIDVRKNEIKRYYPVQYYNEW